MTKYLLLFPLFFLSLSIFAQFQVEHSYESHYTQRHVLQDQNEYFTNADSTKSFVNIYDENHEILHAVPTPDCAGLFAYSYIRSDIAQAEIGIFCACYVSGEPTKYFVMDESGTELQDFKSFVNGNYDFLFSFDEEAFSTTAYQAQTLDSVQYFSHRTFGSVIAEETDETYYVAHNGVDSIYIYNEDLSLDKVIYYDLLANGTEPRITSTSRLENGVHKRYFMIETYDPGTDKELFYLIDEAAQVLSSFVDSNPKFHKYNDIIHITFRHDLGNTGVSAYSIDEDETFPLITNFTIGSIAYGSSGKYLTTVYDAEMGEAFAYDYNRNKVRSIMISDSNYAFGSYFFEDETGNEYFKYTQEIDGIYNTLIYKDSEYLQTLENASNLSISIPKDRELKLITFNFPGNHDSKVYSLNTTAVKEVHRFKLQLSPNPAKDKIQLIADKPLESFEIFDMQGHLIKYGNIDNAALDLDIQDLENGAYLIRALSQDEQFALSKFFKID